jgi:hypothetical protein
MRLISFAFEGRIQKVVHHREPGRLKKSTFSEKAPEKRFQVARYYNQRYDTMFQNHRGAMKHEKNGQT